MKLEEFKRKLHLLAFDQLPFVMKVLRVPPPKEEGHIDIEEHEVDETENLGAAPAGEKELDLEPPIEEDEEGEVGTDEPVEEIKVETPENEKIPLKFLVRQKLNQAKEKLNLERVKNFKHEWAGYSEEEKKEKKKVFFRWGVRGLAVIALLWVLFDDFIFTSEKKQIPDQASNQETISSPNEVVQEDISADMNQELETEINQNLDSDLSFDETVDMNEESLPSVENNQAEMDMNDEPDLNMSDTQDAQMQDSGSDMAADMGDDILGDDSMSQSETEAEKEPESDLEMTDFDKKGYDKNPDENKINEVVFDEPGYKDITSEELETEINEGMSQQDIVESPQDPEIEGVSLSVLRELEEKLKEKELQRDQELLGKKEDLSLRGRKAPAVDFYRAGRALVYNCQGAHWACVDELSFLKCREADTVNRAKKASSTCQPYDVYVSEKDCQRAQYNYMDQEKDGQASCQP